MRQLPDEESRPWLQKVLRFFGRSSTDELPQNDSIYCGAVTKGACVFLWVERRHLAYARWLRHTLSGILSTGALRVYKYFVAGVAYLLRSKLKYTPCIFLMLFLISLLCYLKKMKGFKNKD